MQVLKVHKGIIKNQTIFTQFITKGNANNVRTNIHFVSAIK